jgi:hypothetical protein
MFLYLDYKAMPVQAYKGMGQDGALSPQQHAKKTGAEAPVLTVSVQLFSA